MLADEYDVDLSDEEEDAIESYVEDYREGFEDDDAYLDALHEQYITHELFYDLRPSRHSRIRCSIKWRRPAS